MLLLVCHGSLILIEKYNQKNYWTQNYRLVLGSYKYQDRFFCSVLSDSLLKINHEIDVSRCFKMPRSRDQEIIELLSSLCIPGSAKQYWTNTCTTGEIYLFQSIWVALNLLFWSANCPGRKAGFVQLVFTASPRWNSKACGVLFLELIHAK